MRTFIRARRKAFTLVELMIVVTIVAILALIAIPLYSANTTAAIMSEGVAGAGTIRNAMRVYNSQNGSYTGAALPSGGSAGTLQIGSTDLQGKYFAQSDYSLLSVTASTYTIKAGPPSLTTKTTQYYQINQLGSELGTDYTNQ
jgi:prepilin-type N-terminal cleavage/methylation domain-containing protein